MCVCVYVRTHAKLFITTQVTLVACCRCFLQVTKSYSTYEHACVGNLHARVGNVHVCVRACVTVTGLHEQT